jgi:hypothetical protein
MIEPPDERIDDQPAADCHEPLHERERSALVELVAIGEHAEAAVEIDAGFGKGLASPRP